MLDFVTAAMHCTRLNITTAVVLKAAACSSITKMEWRNPLCWSWAPMRVRSRPSRHCLLDRYPR